MQGPVTRVTENVAVAVATAAVLWLVAHLGMSPATLDHVVADVGGVSATWRKFLWAAAGVLCGLAVLIQVNGWRRTTYNGRSFWEFELRMPSWPVTFLGGAGTLALVGWGLRLCSANNRWGLVALTLAGWMLLRFTGRLRSGWQYMLRVVGRAISGRFARRAMLASAPQHDRAPCLL